MKINPDIFSYIESEIIPRYDHYPELSKEQQYDRNGYLKLWFPESPNAARLEKLRQMIDEETIIKNIFQDVFKTIKNL